jgi:dihydrofolate reductase
MLSIIVAVANNNVIGKDNKLIWHISNDLQRFKEITTRKVIVMGRKTFESLPGILPNRHHIVLTKDESYNIEDDRVSVVNDIQDIINLKDVAEEIFIIGGAEIYKTFLPYCRKLYLTKIDSDFEGDVYFPKIDFDKYMVEKEKFNITKDGLKYSFVNLIIKDDN